MTRRKDPETEAPEPVLEPAPETVAPLVAEPHAFVAEPAAPIPAPEPRRRSGILGPMLGGAIAAASGFGLAHFDVFDLRPDPATDQSAEIAALKGQLAKLSDAAGSVTAHGQKLEARLAALESRPEADLSGLKALEDRMAAIEAMPVDDAASNAALAARLAKIETALQSQPAADTTALKAELDAASARLGEAEAEATTRTGEAEATAAKATRDLSLRALTDAVTSGQPFADKLQALADPALDAALGPMAETGAPTLAALQAGFPDAARETLRLAREISPNDGWSDRLLDFLASQTEARSLTPREGTEPDAVLSRAEFALGQGRVTDALAELAAIDPALVAPLDVWTKDASLYVSTMAALAAAGGE